MEARSERLFAAASVLDFRADEATPGPWGDPADIHYGEYGWLVDGCPAGETEDSQQGKADITYIATMHPQVASRLAEWLQWQAKVAQGNEVDQQADDPRLTFASYDTNTEFAFAIARAVLGKAYG